MNRDRRYGSVEAARTARPDANLAILAVPDSSTARMAKKALDAGLHCVILSGTMSLDDERESKRMARDKGLLVMGPDCGTAIIDGAGLGVANAVPRGPVGVIGTSGTGIQEFTVLLERLAGVGVSHALGVGATDLTPEVGGISTVQSFTLLADDPATECIVFIAQPPEPSLAAVLHQVARDAGKPVIFCLLEPETGTETETGTVVHSIEQAAISTLTLLGRQPDRKWLPLMSEVMRLGSILASQLRPGQTHMRGVFSGSGLCLEAMAHLVPQVDRCHANVGMAGVLPMTTFTGTGTCFWDMGGGRAGLDSGHPILDPQAVAERIVGEAGRRDVGVLMMDVVIGHGANPDPSAILAPAVEQARKVAAAQGRTLHVLVHVCGTDRDPQQLGRQEHRMREAGAIICGTNLQMAKFALATVQSLAEKAAHGSVRGRNRGTAQGRSRIQQS